MQIGELADRTGLSLRTLRHYDDVGLLRPSGRTDGGFRVYSEQDFTRLTLIRRARALKFSLEEINDFLGILTTEPRHPEEVAPDELRALLREARLRRSRLVADLERADEFITDVTTHLDHGPQRVEQT